MARGLEVGGILIRRWLGAWADLLVLALALAPAVLIAGINEQIAGILIWVWVAFAILYFPIGEGLWGRTAGKLLTGLIVVRSDGRVPGVWRAIVRTLLRLFEVNPLLAGGIPAGICVMLSKERQRLGDMVAGTVVIPIKDLQRPAADAAEDASN